MPVTGVRRRQPVFVVNRAVSMLGPTFSPALKDHYRAAMPASWGPIRPAIVRYPAADGCRPSCNRFAEQLASVDEAESRVAQPGERVDRRDNVSAHRIERHAHEVPTPFAVRRGDRRNDGDRRGGVTVTHRFDESGDSRSEHPRSHGAQLVDIDAQA